MEEITPLNKDIKPQSFVLPYSETGEMGDLSVPRDRIEQG